MIKEDKVFVKVNSRNIRYYKELGYNVDVKFQESKNLEVLTKHIPKNSIVKITAICDICQSERELTILKYNSNFSRNGFYSCFKCKNVKKEITNKIKYGVSSFSKTEEFKNKYKSTCLKKFGVENPNMLKEIRNKTKNTCLEKYGVSTHLILPENIKKSKVWMSSNEFKEKSKNTLMEKYGVDSYSKTEQFKKILEDKKEIIIEKMKLTVSEKWKVEFYSKTEEWKIKYLEKLEETKNKIKETCLKKYNVENVSQLPQIYNKIKETKISRKQILPDIEIKPWELYRRKVKKITKMNKKTLFENWNGLDYYDSEKIVGYFSLSHTHRYYPTIDHKISVFYGYKNGLNPEFIGGLDNLCITKRCINSIKKDSIESEFNLLL